MTDPEIAVINLARSTERRAHIVRQFESTRLSYRFFDAIDGRAGDHPLFTHYRPDVAMRRRGILLSKGELGVWASHYLLWQYCVAEKKPLLICEDDIELGPNFPTAYQAIRPSLDRYGLIRFSGVFDREFRVCEHVSDDLKIIRFLFGPSGAACYALTPAAALKLIATANVWFEPLDDHLDRFWTHNVGCFALQPYPVKQAAWSWKKSDIWADEQHPDKSNKFRKHRLFYKKRDKFLRAVSNYLYRDA